MPDPTEPPAGAESLPQPKPHLDAGLAAAFGLRGPGTTQQHSVLDAIARITGQAPKVLLPDDSGPDAASPLIKAGARESCSTPAGKGNYQILGEIARGGMGAVMKAHDLDLGRDVALKVLHESLASDPVTLNRFVEEAQIGAQLQHPGIVPVYDLGLMADDRPYFTMKLVKGRTLSSLLAEREESSSERRHFLTIFEQVCQTMAYAHSRSVIHRDLKPSNVMVGAFGEVQVVDWGLAKVLTQGGTADERREQENFSEVTVLETVRSGDGSSHSRAGSIMGTPAYMSPEQARGEVAKIDERSDVFSLGAILCQLLTGRPPYLGSHDVAMRSAADAELDDAYARLDACGADADLLQLTKRCLAPAPTARPNKAEVVAKAIHELLARAEDRAHRAEIGAAEARVKATAERRARKLTLALAATVLVSVVVGGGGYLGYQGRERERQTRLARSVQSALDDGALQQSGGELDAALGAFERAASLAEQGVVDSALLTRIAEQRGSILELLAARDAAQDLATRNGRLFAALEKASVLELHDVRRDSGPRPIDTRHSPNPVDDEETEHLDQEAGRDRAFGEAFWDYGLVPELLDQDGALETIRSSGEALRIAVYLDDWARVQRHIGKVDSAQVLMKLAQGADPDAWRNRLRDALKSHDVPALLELASGADLDTLPKVSAYLLGQALALEGQAEAAVELLTGVVRRHPDDFQVRYQLAYTLGYVEPTQYFDALRHVEASLALRPNSVLALGLETYVLRKVDKIDESIELARRALELNPEDTWSRRQLGWSLWFGDDREAALIEVEEAASRDPEDSHACDDLAWMLWKSGNLQAAERAAQDSVRLHPNHAAAHKTLAEVLWRLGRLEDAITSYDKAALLDPGNNYLHATALRLDGRFAEAITILLAITKPSVNWYHSLGCSYEGLGDLEQAAQTFQASVEFAPEHADLWEHLGGVLMNLRRHEEAIGPLQRGIELAEAGQGPNAEHDDAFRSRLYADLGSSYNQLAKFEEALSAVEMSLGYDPDFWFSKNLRCNILLSAGNYETFEKFRRELLEEKPEDLPSLSSLGAVLVQQLGRPEEGIEMLLGALTLAPERAETHHQLGHAYEALGERELAASSYREGLRLSDTLQRTHFRWTLIYVLPEESPEVLELYKEMVADQPDDVESLNYVAWTFVKDPDSSIFDPDAGLELAGRAVALAPDNSFCWNTYGTTLLRVGRYEEAIESCLRSVELSGRFEYAENWFVIALARHALGQAQEARQALAKARELHTQTPERSPDLARLAAEALALIGEDEK